MSDQINPGASRWQQACEAAEHETDPTKLLEYLTATESAIFDRLQEMEVGAEERQAISKAIAILRRLQIERLKFPEWEVKEA